MILITGATGTVGSEIIQRLAAQSVPVRAITRDLRKVQDIARPHVEFVQGDFEDLESMRRACTGVERAFLLTNSTDRAEAQQVAFSRVAEGERRAAHREAMRAALLDLGFPSWQADGLLEEFAIYRRAEAATVETGVRDALARPPRSFDEFARAYAQMLM